MRKVVLRWRLSTIEASKDLSRLLKIFDRFEVLAHLGVSSIGIVQLAEIEVKEGRDIHELDELDELDIGGAFTARERKRIRSSSRLGAGGVERVERADGTWYVNPEPSGNAR